MSANVPTTRIGPVPDDPGDSPAGIKSWRVQIARAVNFLLSSKTSNLWVPADGSGAGLTFTGVSAGYTQNDNIVFHYAALAWPATANGANAVISGLPAIAVNQNYANSPFIVNNSSTIAIEGQVQKNTGNIFLFAAAGNARLTNANLSGVQLYFFGAYPVA